MANSILEQSARQHQTGEPPQQASPCARILICVSGSISAYKAADLVSILKKKGHDVRCLMTAGAEKFVTPLVLETLSGHPVRTELFPTGSSLEEGGTEHIRIARWADLVVYAPASANLIARLAHGLCDDLVTTVALATRAPSLLVPAMNTAMWEHPATQGNIEQLRARGMNLLDPASGTLACGEEGPGKLPTPETIAGAVENLLARAGAPATIGAPAQRLLITAGPTISKLDAVRYLTNPSTGKMGAALAEAALQAGCEVFYVLGVDKGVVTPKILPEHLARFHLTRVETAEEMRDAALGVLPQVDGVIATAAVLDYRVTETYASKRKRTEDQETWTLAPSADVLRTLRDQGTPRQWFCGFAAETDEVEKNGLKKLREKRLNFLFSNAVSRSGDALSTGFGSDQNSGTLHDAAAEDALRFPLSSKRELATQLIRELLLRSNAQKKATETQQRDT